MKTVARKILLNRIFSAQMPTNEKKHQGLVLVEIIVVVVIIGALATLAIMNISGVFNKSRIDVRSQELINILKMASDSAAQTETRYEIVFDFAEQSWTLREMLIDADPLAQHENIIETGRFDQQFQLSYIQFDDYEATNEDVAIFRVGKAGFQYGGKIVILDENGQPYSIVINRLGSIIEFTQDDAELIAPKDKDEMPF